MVGRPRNISYGVAKTMVPVVVTILCLILTGHVSFARKPVTYMVGDEDGWGLVFPMDSWAEGKTFYAGDILVFRYNYQYRNLVVVNRTGYETCIPNEGSVEYDSGDDRIRLPFGHSYYIGVFYPVDCSGGMKMAINGLAPPPTLN